MSSSSYQPGALFWRRLAHLGASRGPRAWLRFSPPFFGLAFALALRPQREQVRANMRRVVGARTPFEEYWDVARTFSSYASCLAESLAVGRPELAKARRRFRNPEVIRRVLGPGRGAVVATAHFGAWDVAGPLLAEDLGAPVVIAMQAEPDAKARELHDAVRKKGGVRVVHVGEHPLAALPLLHHLRDGGVVAVQLDRLGPDGRALPVTLFGQPFRVPEGPFQLAAIAGVPLLPLFVRRRGYLDYELTAGAPVELGRRPPREELVRAAQKATAEMERAIFSCPTQWFHFEPE